MRLVAGAAAVDPRPARPPGGRDRPRDRRLRRDPAYAAVAVAVTLLLAALQTLVGAWLARALVPRRPSAASEDPGR